MHSKKILLIISMLLFIVFTFSSCNTGGVPQLSVTNVRFIPSPMMIGMASVFLKITNSGNSSDTLIACSIKEYPAASGALHDVIDRKMVKQEEIKIPANHNTDLKPGSKHLMFSGLPEKLEEEITLILSFKKTAPIEARTALDSD
jgi:copper(I)-binding protein